VTSQALFTEFKRYLTLGKAPVKQIWDGEINYGVKGPGTVPHVALDNALGAAYVVRTYLDALRMGISRVYWSAWVPRGPVYGITMFPGSPGAAAQRTAYAWLAGKWWRGCTTTAYSTGAFLSCKVTTTTSARSAVATIAWSEGAARRMAVPAGDHHICNAVGACTLTAPGRVVTVGASPLRFVP
jgi:hypothetical protein